jgi:hypothetical protein
MHQPGLLLQICCTAARYLRNSPALARGAKVMKNCVLELIAARNFQRIRWKEPLSSVRERFLDLEARARSEKQEVVRPEFRNRQCTEFRETFLKVTKKNRSQLAALHLKHLLITSSAALK